MSTNAAAERVNGGSSARTSPASRRRSARSSGVASGPTDHSIFVRSRSRANERAASIAEPTPSGSSLGLPTAIQDGVTNLYKF